MSLSVQVRYMQVPTRWKRGLVTDGPLWNELMAPITKGVGFEPLPGFGWTFFPEVSEAAHPGSRLGGQVARHTLDPFKSEEDHESNGHQYKRNEAIPEWRGWHACRRGLGSNLYRLGVRDVVIQRILRHANVSTTTGYYIKTMDDDVKEAMTKLEKSIPKPALDTIWTPAGTATRPI